MPFDEFDLAKYTTNFFTEIISGILYIYSRPHFICSYSPKYKLLFETIKSTFCFFFNTIKPLKPLISHANWTIKVNAKWVLHHHVHVGVSLPRALFGYLMVIWCWQCQQTHLTLVYLTVLTTRGCFIMHTFFV